MESIRRCRALRCVLLPFLLLGLSMLVACDPLDDEGSDYERHPPADAGQGSHGAWGDGDEITGTFGEKG